MNGIKIAFFICWALASCKNVETKTIQDKSPQNAQKPIEVSGQIITITVVDQQTTASGTIMANEEVELKSEVNGKVDQISFSEGSYVSKGQTLFTLEDDDLMAQQEKIKIEIQLLEDKERRQKQLLAAEAIGQEEYDVNRTNIQLLKANLKILKTQIDKTIIQAPFSGVIGLRSISEGAIISPNTVVSTIQNINPLKLDFSIPEKYSDLVRNGHFVYFTTSSQKEPYKATVYARDPKVDVMTRTLKMRAKVNNDKGLIMPGSFAEVTIPLGKGSQAIMIPSYACIPDIKGSKVFVSKDGKAISTSVQTGVRTDREIQILEGLQKGDTLITSGILQLKPNMPVRIKLDATIE